jgi:hypothetical protein
LAGRGLLLAATALLLALLTFPEPAVDDCY